MSNYYNLSIEQLNTNLKLPEIAEFKSVQPIHSAFIVPIYIGDRYIDDENNPYLNTLRFDHPYPVYADTAGILKVSELSFIDALKNFDAVLNNKYNDLPENFKYPVFIVVGAVKKELSETANDWLKETINKYCEFSNISVKFINNEVFEKIFNALVFPAIKNESTEIKTYIKKIYETGLCSYPNIRNFSELLTAMWLTAKYPNESCGLIEVDEDQLIELDYCNLLKKENLSFLSLGLSGLGSRLKNGGIIGFQAGEYYKYNPDLPIAEAIKISDVGAGSMSFSDDIFYQKNNLYSKSIEWLYSVNSDDYRHPSVRGGLIFSLADSLFSGNVFCFDWITRGEDTARLITVYGETTEELRFIHKLKMAHNQSSSIKKLMKAGGADVANVRKTFIADMKRWKLKSELINYYKEKNIAGKFSPYPAGMFDNIDSRIELTMLLKIMDAQTSKEKTDWLNSWTEIFEYSKQADIKNNYPLFLNAMKEICVAVNPRKNNTAEKLILNLLGD